MCWCILNTFLSLALKTITLLKQISYLGHLGRLTCDQAPHWGEKKQNRRAKRAERCNLRRGKGGAALPPPQSTAGLTSLADIFPIWTRFLPFSLTAEPGPKLRKTSFYNSYE